MKNLLKKQLLLAFVMGFSLFSGHSMVVAMGNEAHTPFGAEYQKILDELVKKFNAGNPGDYKVYINNSASIYTQIENDEKKILVGDEVLRSLSQRELEFAFGGQICYMQINKDDVAKKAMARANKHRLNFTVGGSVSIGLPTYALNMYFNSSWPVYLVTTGFAAVTGSLMGMKIAEYCGCTNEEYISSDMQKIIHELDEKLVEKLDCHEDAINYINRLNEAQQSKGEINIFPLKEKRIARIVELWAKKAQQGL